MNDLLRLQDLVNNPTTRAVSYTHLPRKISNIVELMKLAALVEDFPPEPDRIHLSNGTLFLDGTFAKMCIRDRTYRNCQPHSHERSLVWN